MFTREQPSRTGTGRGGRVSGRTCPSAENRMDTGLKPSRTDWTGTFVYFFKKMEIYIIGKKRRYKGFGKAPRPVRPRPPQHNKHAGLGGRVCPSGCPSGCPSVARPAHPLPVRGSVAL